MKTFKGIRPMDEIKRRVAEMHGEVDTTEHDAMRSDYVRISAKFGCLEGRNAQVLFSHFNGVFFGKLDDGTAFSNRSDELDGQPWYDAILDTLYA